LNFVSYQDTPDRLIFVLKTIGWLGGVNFGGGEQQQPPGMEALLAVHAAGIFLCPPAIDGEPFPGQSIFQAVDGRDAPRRSSKRRPARARSRDARHR
jgi:hypothetical protein